MATIASLCALLHLFGRLPLGAPGLFLVFLHVPLLGPLSLRPSSCPPCSLSFPSAANQPSAPTFSRCFFFFLTSVTHPLLTRTSRGLNIFWGVRSKLNRKCFFYANHTAGLARLVAMLLPPTHPPQHKPVNSVAEAPVNHERLCPGACNARAGWNLILQNGARQKQAAVQCTARRLAD